VTGSEEKKQEFRSNNDQHKEGSYRNPIACCDLCFEQWFYKICCILLRTFPLFRCSFRLFNLFLFTFNSFHLSSTLKPEQTCYKKKGYIRFDIVVENNF